MVRQGAAARLYDLYMTWQSLLGQLSDTLPSNAPPAPELVQPFPGDQQVGAVLSRQIFELLGRGIFPSHLEADLVSLRQLFVDFDTLHSQQERHTRLSQAQSMLSGLQVSTCPVAAVQNSQPRLAPVALKANSSHTHMVNHVNETPGGELWNLPIRFGKGVGPSRARLLEKLGIVTVEDAFWFLPWRYEDWSTIIPIHQLHPAMNVTVSGSVTSCRVRRTSRKGVVIVTITIDDGTGVLEAAFFNQPFLEQVFAPGTSLLLHGEVAVGNTNRVSLLMRAPQHEVIRHDNASGHGVGRVVPVYHETKGMTSRQFRRILIGLHERYGDAIDEILPPHLLKKLQLPTLQSSVTALHFPECTENVEELTHGITCAHRRLAFEELLLLQLALAVRRSMIKTESRGIEFAVQNRLEKAFRALLPFTLTTAQERVIQEIQSDMQGPMSMNRLLQGDVGSGKTMVALHAIVTACGSGYQAALMAPTEVLSEQHFLNIEPYCSQLGITVVRVKGSQSVQDRTRVLRQLASGHAQVAVGTHALLQPAVEFKNLGLVIVDEQHKFGVVQRAQLRKKGTRPPDVLVMTATPIPRTLAMTVYGDLDVSVIDRLPPGRKPVRTLVFDAQERERAYAFVQQEVHAGRQAYIVYPLVEPSEKIDLQAAVDAAERLQQEEFRELKVGLLHGRMKSKEKQATMTAFTEGYIHVLVTTTVIEVGVDVSNASIILIEHAERFGLAQLHQLRGRVGRGAQQALCVLVRSAIKPVVQDSPVSGDLELPFPQMPASPNSLDSFNESPTQVESHRLHVFARCADGFALAEEDLKLRGPGNVLGVQQWGSVDFRVAQPFRDQQLLVQAKQIAAECLAQDPQLTSSKNQRLKAAMLRKWGEAFELGSIG
ncbi:MAG: ATP-dependent DNA helicase RecG [Nitrospirales bacterium]|nr:MAG: ATP-dependent DNA helicase RecG [Nitrospirales bacterium]